MPAWISRVRVRKGTDRKSDNEKTDPSGGARNGGEFEGEKR